MPSTFYTWETVDDVTYLTITDENGVVIEKYDHVITVGDIRSVARLGKTCHTSVYDSNRNLIAVTERAANGANPDEKLQ